MRTALVAVVALVVSACGGGSVQIGASSEIDPADQTAAESALVTLDDLGAGWIEEPRDEDDAESDAIFARIAAEIPSCEGYENGFEPSEAGEVTARAPSPTFVMDDAEVEHTVTVFSSVAEAEAAFDVFADDRLIDCSRAAFPRFFDELLAADAEAPPIDDIFVVVGRSPALAAGDASSAVQIQVTVTVQGDTADVFLDAHATRIGRSVSSFSFQNAFVRFDDRRQAELIELGASRLAAELG